jgi:hypothetical protein
MTAGRELGRFGFLWYSVTHWPYRNFYTPEFLAPKATASAQRERKAMSIRGFLIGTRAEPGVEKRPGRLCEIIRPRKAEAMWAALEAEEDRLIEGAVAQELAENAMDRAYIAYLADWESGQEHGNPPDSRLLDDEIDHFARQYPEVTEAGREQAGYYEEAYERGPRWSYTEYEGSGFTEPLLDWEGWHHDHKGWTFTEWAEERGWDPEYVAEINAQFPPDQGEIEYDRKCKEHAAEAEADDYLDEEPANPYDQWPYLGTYWPQREAGR